MVCSKSRSLTSAPFGKEQGAQGGTWLLVMDWFIELLNFMSWEKIESGKLLKHRKEECTSKLRLDSNYYSVEWSTLVNFYSRSLAAPVKTICLGTWPLD